MSTVQETNLTTAVDTVSSLRVSINCAIISAHVQPGWHAQCRFIFSFCCYSEHRRRSGWTSGGTHGQRRRWVRVEWDGIWVGVSPLQPTKRFGGASWAPPVESGAEPRPKTDFGVFWKPQNAHFCTYMTKSGGGQFVLASPRSKFWGDLSPCLPVIYAHDSEQNKRSWCLMIVLPYEKWTA